MESIERKYLTLKQKIHDLSQEIKDHRKVLNQTANVLLNFSDTYEFQTVDLVISKPTNHTSRKKKD